MILANDRERVAAWVCERIRDMTMPERDYEALGVLFGGDIIGGVIYNEYREIAPNEYDIRMHSAGYPGWLTKSSLRAFFGYPFLQLNCIRVTGVVAKANRRARQLNNRLGFRDEGCIKDGFGTGRDAILMGMRRAECQWIS